MAEQILDRTIHLPDGTKIEAKAHNVPESDRFPEGIKYSFQYFDPETGQTLLRYDNHYEHADTKHHKHRDGEKHPVEYEGNIEDHFRKFRKEVLEIHDQR